MFQGRFIIINYLYFLSALCISSSIVADNVSGGRRETPWSGMEKHDSVQLLIRWKVRENEYSDNYKIRRLGEDRSSFKELIKHKSSLVPGDHDIDEIHRRLEEANDSNVKVTVDIRTLGVTAVNGTVSYFEEIDLTNHVAVDIVELDGPVGIYEDPPTIYPNSSQSVLTVSSQYSDNEPEGIGLVQASRIPNPTNLIKACLVDTGYDDGHPDLPSSMEAGHSVEGVSNSQFKDNWNVDNHGHGTLVAGIMFAIANNNGIHGINPDPLTVGVVAAKGLGSDGHSTQGKSLKALADCAKFEGVKVLNLSYGGTSFSQIESDAIAEFYNNGQLIVAAAGNSAQSTKIYPASYPTVISVGSIEKDGSKSWFSHFNDQIEISAPGADVQTTMPRSSGVKYQWATGTSLSAPHISGVLMKVWSHFPECKNYQIRQAMLKTASSNHPDCNNSIGHGLIQGKMLYDNLKLFGCGYGGTETQWETINPTPAVAASGGCNENMHFVTVAATDAPTLFPTEAPTVSPTDFPSVFPTGFPSVFPTGFPSVGPTSKPLKKKFGRKRTINPLKTKRSKSPRPDKKQRKKKAKVNK